jgi:sulfite reductase (NADPH) flavoprotein alpha-component
MLSTLRIENSPFNETQLKQLQSSIGGLNAVQSQWLSGYLAGRLAGPLQTASTENTNARAVFDIIYATETGHSETIAGRLSESLEQQGISTKLHSMDGFRPAALRKLRNAAFVISTHGEGDPPDEALEIFEYLGSDRAPELNELNYRVLALGDKSYQLFCEAGRKLDERLRALGARPFGQRLECDVDFATTAKVYSDEIIEYARANLATEDQVANTDQSINNHLSLVPNETRWSRENPFAVTLGQTQRITSKDSSKDVHHIELSLEGSGIQYQPGDALGVWAPNDPELVARILESLKLESSTPVSIDNRSLSLGEALTNHLEITRLSSETILGYADEGKPDALKAYFSGLEPARQQRFVEKRQLLDLVDEFPVRIEPEALVRFLRPLTPRSYSIASSQQLVDDEVHLTVATLHSNATGEVRQGTASGFLNQRFKTDQQVKVFLEPNNRFRLPENPDTPIIMIAAGTGIAPYRAFLQELENRTDSPDSWLIFGNLHLRNDFLYQREWLRWRNSGLLNRIDTAWSRDQAEKRYVQDVVLEQAERIDQWLQRGAHIYLCGSLKMGQAVQQNLQTALAEQRAIPSESAASVLTELRQQRRIKKDLY